MDMILAQPIANFEHRPAAGEAAARLGVSQKSIYIRLRNLGGQSRATKTAENMEGLASEVARLKVEFNKTKLA
jgi:hypothetical protein